MPPSNEKTMDIASRIEQLSHVTIEQAGDGIVWIDESSERVIRANPAACRFLGYSEQELLQLRVADFDLDHTSATVRDLHRQIGAYRSCIFESRHCRKDGRVYPVEITSTIVDFHGHEYSCSFFKDITERKAAEQRLQAENVYLQEEIGTGEIIGSSPAIRTVMQQIRQVAVTDAGVLILGETGSGKELVARAVHALSLRSARPLVKVNCAALPGNLIESELFGHEKGAFTGALTHRIGRFELADHGTIFLDEIGDLPLELQSKLLRVLQEGEFERLGNPQTITTDVRLIAATNRDLELLVEHGRFRRDLYYRLNVFPIHCPPLRERKDDIPFLVNHFIGQAAARLGRPISDLPREAMERLLAYDWPGNIRELENTIDRAVIVSEEGRLGLGDWFCPQILEHDHSLEEIERRHILKILDQTSWRVSGERGAARILGLKPTTLESRMKKLGIKRPL